MLRSANKSLEAGLLSLCNGRASTFYHSGAVGSSRRPRKVFKPPLTSKLQYFKRHSHNSVGLIPPDVIYSDNHLLVVNKYPGWHTVPNESSHNNTQQRPQNKDEKCLLTHLQKQKLGGGSQKDFLKPMHRIDQPCSGVLMLGKTSKAASRVTHVWKEKLVDKTYLCMIERNSMDRLLENSNKSPGNETDWYELHGYYQGKTRPDPNNPNPPVGWNVKLTAEQGHKTNRQLTCQFLPLDDMLVLVKTNEGGRHQVRALLSQLGRAPILGDIRYGSSKILPDQSVALHARSVTLPESFQLGSTEQRSFIAPIPPSWRTFGGVSEGDVLDLLRSSTNR